MPDQYEIGSMAEAIALLDLWIDAYEQLRLDNVRLMQKYITTKEALSHARFAIECDLALEAEEKPFA